jgi:glycerol-3-phosphate dehydrogenase (NAD(P)+)
MSSLLSPKILQTAVIGGGSWATAQVKILCNTQEKVYWWLRSDESVNHILKFKHNPKYLQSVEFNTDKLVVSSNLEEIINEANYIIIATPSAFLTKLFENVPKDIFHVFLAV